MSREAAAVCNLHPRLMLLIISPRSEGVTDLERVHSTTSSFGTSEAC
jgi:hypothetical protein